MDGFILINKPEGITSHTLVLKARRALRTDKIGHTGTLDPFAGGLMMLTVGKATKILPFIAEHRKSYVAVLKLGILTDTLDITGNIIEEREKKQFSEEQIRDVLASFIGDQKQIPPMYSAKKVNGQTLYDLARKNVTVERKPTDINIGSIDLIEHDDDSVTFSVECSSGTYIRVLGKDIAERLGTVGTLSGLKRTAIDSFNLEDACSLEDLSEGRYSIISAYEMLKGYPYYEMEDVSDVLNGKTIRLDTDAELVMITHDNEVIAAYQRLENGFYHCKRGLW